jgi:hypothetical protein
MAVPYFWQTTPIALDDIPNKYMKVENPARANIIHDEAALLVSVIKRLKYHRIKINLSNHYILYSN